MNLSRGVSEPEIFDNRCLDSFKKSGVLKLLRGGESCHTLGTLCAYIWCFASFRAKTGFYSSSECGRAAVIKTKERNEMKSITGILAAVGIAGLLLTQPALAGEGKKTLQENVAVEEARKWWAASLGAGWDSLYMFRESTFSGLTKTATNRAMVPAFTGRR